MRYALIAIAILTMPLLAAETPAKRSPEQRQASYDAHRADFDYLLGDWEFTANSQQFGKFRGYWSAVRIGDGADILDEYRVVGDHDETFYVTRTLRVYNSAADRWELVSTDTGSGLQNFGTGHRDGSEMRIEQTFGAVTPNPSVLRIRYYDIRPDQFSWTADRSIDGGKTWTPKFQTIEAHRIGAARSLEPLTHPKKH